MTTRLLARFETRVTCALCAQNQRPIRREASQAGTSPRLGRLLCHRARAPSYANAFTASDRRWSRCHAVRSAASGTARTRPPINPLVHLPDRVLRARSGRIRCAGARLCAAPVLRERVHPRRRRRADLGQDCRARGARPRRRRRRQAQGAHRRLRAGPGRHAAGRRAWCRRRPGACAALRAAGWLAHD